MRNEIRMPCHKPCQKALKLSLIWKNFLLIFIMIFVVLIDHYYLNLGLWGFNAFALLTLVVFYYICPLYIDFKMKNNDNDIQIIFFEDEDYAKKFALMNNRVVIEE